MGLLSFFQRRNGDAGRAAAGALPDDDVAAARTRARRRLLGAAVLVMVGVIAFPLVFETQPRPIPVDIPIDIPRKDGAPGLAMPPLRPTAPKASAVAARPREEPITETAAEAGKEVAPAPQAAASVATPKKPAAVAAAARPAASAGDGGRARALLEGKEPATAKTAEAAHEAGRFVVQVGAFADEAAARETRSKVDKLGLKSYTQVVETASGSRIRVRAGPFSSRDEADKAMAKARAAGLTAVVLTL